MFLLSNIAMSIPHHPGFNALFTFADALYELSREIARESRKRPEARRGKARRGATLRPGDDTPLWNALVAMVQPTLRRRGAKAILARELGVHRSRVTGYFTRRSTMPDAERALRLLLWISRQSRGQAQ
jgi:hypothetical protein